MFSKIWAPLVERKALPIRLAHQLANKAVASRARPQSLIPLSDFGSEHAAKEQVKKMWFVEPKDKIT